MLTVSGEIRLEKIQAKRGVIGHFNGRERNAWGEYAVQSDDLFRFGHP